MNYQKIYENLVSNVKQQNRVKLSRNELDYIYYENHHIKPRSLGGNNKKDNLVLLTAREHFIAHKLLSLFLEGKDKQKMIFALHRLTYSKNYGHLKSSRDYKFANEMLSISMSGENNPMYNKIVSNKTRQKLSNSNKGHPIYWKDLTTYWKDRTKSEDHLRKISKALKGRIPWNKGKKNVYSKETLEKMCKPQSKETKLKISKANKGKIPWNKGLTSKKNI